ncbi:hypothetical protein MJG53_019022 [Ovis ammon polii x Ovis aries]|uniref:Uncharacterized protein n=1 Tax=Ovis ammon polii x Ovis aries TaxID=2918886 RepID=A0ACB9U3V9_9CETA|nr:hypothetical protein MJG53_019022 [Ovis ammon polii x Ovis aries]
MRRQNWLALTCDCVPAGCHLTPPYVHLCSHSSFFSKGGYDVDELHTHFIMMSDIMELTSAISEQASASGAKHLREDKLIITLWAKPRPFHRVQGARLNPALCPPRCLYPRESEVITVVSTHCWQRTMNIEAYFERIGYKNSRDKLDLETLADILQHQVQAIPFENLNIHCGEAMELDLEAIFDQIVRRNRGGWCLQVNHLLYWALTTIGFETTMLGGYVYNTFADKYSNAMIHLLLKVTIDGRDYIADAGFGRSYQMWQPLELISGKYQPQMPCIFRLTEERGTWYLDQIRREQYIPNQEFLDSDLLEKNEYRKIYSFTLEPRTIKDFESVNTYLQESPASVFTRAQGTAVETAHIVTGANRQKQDTDTKHSQSLNRPFNHYKCRCANASTAKTLSVEKRAEQGLTAGAAEEAGFPDRRAPAGSPRSSTVELWSLKTGKRPVNSGLKKLDG